MVKLNGAEVKSLGNWLRKEISERFFENILDVLDDGQFEKLIEEWIVYGQYHGGERST